MILNIKIFQKIEITIGKVTLFHILKKQIFKKFIPELFYFNFVKKNVSFFNFYKFQPNETPTLIEINIYTDRTGPFKIFETIRI